MGSPTATEPPCTTQASVPRRPSSSRCSPGRTSSIREQGVHGFDISTTASGPRPSLCPAATDAISIPPVVTFSRTCPGSRRRDSRVSSSIRSTWWALRLRLGVACLSPSMPRPATKEAVSTTTIGCLSPTLSRRDTTRPSSDVPKLSLPDLGFAQEVGRWHKLPFDRLGIPPFSAKPGPGLSYNRTAARSRSPTLRQLVWW